MGLFNWIFGTPDRDAFARQVIDALRRGGEKRPVRYDKEAYTLEIGPSKELVLHLGNSFDEFRSAGRSDREAVVERYARAALQASAEKQVPARYEEAKANLRPRLRERAYLDVRRFMRASETKRLPALPHVLLAESYAVTLVYDLPDSMMEVTDDQLGTWGVTFEKALADARENLWETSKERLEEASPGLWASPWRDNYDASRLVLHDLIWQYRVAGDPVAVVPNRDTLLVAGSEDGPALERLFTRAEEALRKPRPMGGFPVRLRDREWVPFVLPPDHPQHRAWKRLQVISWAQEYGAQKEILDPWYQAQEDDVFVATYTAVEQQDTKEFSSYCVWSDGLPSLLPVADRVGFFRPDEPKDRQVIGMYPWERVRTALSDLMTREGLWPERWRVRKFPTAGQLAALAKE